MMKKEGWVVVCAVLALTVGAQATAVYADNSKHEAHEAIKFADLERAFDRAAKEFGVPKELLMAISYNETRWQVEMEVHEEGEPLKNNGVGLMHLSDSSHKQGLSRAAEALGYTKEDLEHDYVASIRGGAYLLAQYQKELNKPESSGLGDWFEATVAYLGSPDATVAKLYAEQVFNTLQEGATLTVPELGTMKLRGTRTVPNKGKYNDKQYTYESLIGADSADYAPAIWNAAYSGNFQAATRPTSHPIKHVIIHDTEGSYASAISWFKDPASSVSAHYVIRSSDGQITQMVAEKDIAWHARNFNTNGIGIEHEGYANQTGWYTEAMYQSSAALTRAILQKYGLPMTRDYVFGHFELWGNTHTDPGNYWDWNKFMSYVTGVTKNYSVVVVDNKSAGFTKYGPAEYWRSVTGYGLNNEINWTNGLATSTTPSNYAIWKPTIPTAGNYEVKVFIPSNYAATTNAKYQITYNGGTITKTVSQASYSNEWVSLGTYSFAAGTAGQVKLTDVTGEATSIAFDSIKFMAR